MYSRCITCGVALGTNEVVETFPVGRRIAFDPAKGRLWVLCGSCRTWNLAPIEERWEAVESAERAFERAALGASTENVALSRVADGTELLRVGRVEGPELAAWRFGDRLTARWRRFARRETVVIGIGVAVLSPAPTSVVTGVLGVMAGLEVIRGRRPIMHLPEHGPVLRRDAFTARLIPAADGAWALSIDRRDGTPIELRGDTARRVLRRMMPRINHMGGRDVTVRNAVDEVERLGSTERVLRHAAIDLGDLDSMTRRWIWPRPVPGRVSTAHPVIQLALEMAVNDDIERRALHGEMAMLEREWREAEEIASIADDLILPPAIRARLQRWKIGTEHSD